MGFLSVLLAAAAAWIFGAIWYGVFGKRWMAAVGLTEETVNRSNPVPYIVSFICAVLVAGMMRHMLTLSGIGSFGGGLVSGLGLGAFIVAPWIVTNYLYAQRDKVLILIDAGYAIGGCTLIGIVLTLF